MLHSLPIVEDVLVRAAGVLNYSDLYERMGDHPSLFRPFRAILKRRVPPVFQRAGVVFIHIPKNGGTATANALYGRAVWHNSVRWFTLVEPQLFETLPSFSLLRDPIDRTLSAYWMLRRGGGSAVAVLPRIARRLPDMTELQPYLDFLEESLDRIYMTDFVMRPQQWFLTAATGEVLVRDLFLLGRDDAALARYLRRFGVTTVERVNATDRGDAKLSTRQEEQIRRIYAADFTLIDTAGRPVGAAQTADQSAAFATALRTISK